MSDIKGNVVSSQRETTVTFLKDPEVNFVSLVRHGANNTPFRVIKSNKGGLMSKVIQAIMVPLDQEVDLKALVGEDIRDDVITEDGGYKLFEQVEKSACDPDTKSVIVIDPEQHVYAVTYDLKEKLEAPPEGPVVKDNKIEGELPEEGINVKAVSLYDVWDEVMAMADVVMGNMQQSEASPEERSSSILKAIDNLRRFCEAAFKAVKATDFFVPPRKIGEADFEGLKDLQTQVKELLDVHSKGGKDMFNFENKEEAVEFIAGVVAGVLDDRDQKLQETDEAKKAKVEQEAKDKDYEELQKTVKELTDKLEKVSGVVINKSPDGDDLDDDDPEKKIKKTVYTGMFGNLRKTAPSVSDQR